MRTRPTRTGLAVFTVLLSSLLLYIPSRDVVLALTALVSGALLSIDTVAVYRWSRASCRAFSRERSLRTYVDRPVSIEIELYCGEKVLLRPLSREVSSIEPIEGGEGPRLFRATLRFSRHGVYKRISLEAVRTSPLGLFEVSREVYIETEAVVYPETVLWLRLIERVVSGRGGLGDYGTGPLVGVLAGLLRSRTGEYYCSREYVVGDDLRYIDWRATARRQVLYVKDYVSSGGGGGVLVYIDPLCLDPRGCDELASSILSTVLTLYTVGLEASLTVRRGESLDHVERLSGIELVKRGIEEALSLFEDRLSDVFEYVDPDTVYFVKRLLGGVGRGPEPPGRPGIQRPGVVVVVSSLLRDPLRDIGPGPYEEAVALTISRPWASGSLEESYLAYITHQRVKRSLERGGFRVFVWRPVL